MLRYTYTGESVNSLAGIESSSFSSPVVQQGSWRTIDIQAGVETDTWSASLYVDNVTDENGELFFNNRFAQQRLTVNQPRSFGFWFRYKFGGK
jgi:outer membrane receptor protein involved in Fe transport